METFAGKTVVTYPIFIENIILPYMQAIRRRSRRVRARTGKPNSSVEPRIRSAATTTKIKHYDFYQ